MKAIQITLLVQDNEIEEKIADLEERCKKLDISLQGIFQATATTIPTKPFVDILLSLSDVKILDIERENKYKKIWRQLNVKK